MTKGPVPGRKFKMYSVYGMVILIVANSSCIPMYFQKARLPQMSGLKVVSAFTNSGGGGEVGDQLPTFDAESKNAKIQIQFMVGGGGMGTNF